MPCIYCLFAAAFNYEFLPRETQMWILWAQIDCVYRCTPCNTTHVLKTKFRVGSIQWRWHFSSFFCGLHIFAELVSLWMIELRKFQVFFRMLLKSTYNRFMTFVLCVHFFCLLIKFFLSVATRRPWLTCKNNAPQQRMKKQRLYFALSAFRKKTWLSLSYQFIYSETSS